MIDALSSGYAHTLRALYSNYVLMQAQHADKGRGTVRAFDGSRTLPPPLRIPACEEGLAHARAKVGIRGLRRVGLRSGLDQTSAGFPHREGSLHGDQTGSLFRNEAKQRACGSAGDQLCVAVGRLAT